MRTVTVKISDKDYDDLVAHLANDKVGKPLVAVIAVVADGDGFATDDGISCPACGYPDGDAS